MRAEAGAEALASGKVAEALASGVVAGRAAAWLGGSGPGVAVEVGPGGAVAAPGWGAVRGEVPSDLESAWVVSMAGGKMKRLVRGG